MNFSILFVDDEQMVLKGLKRSLHTMRAEWEMHFALSGEEGLRILEQEEVDLVISDMYMPGMDGAQFLSRVQAEHPHAVRMILSGHSDQQLLLKIITPAHKFLSKPCSKDSLVQSVQRVQLCRRFVSDPGLRSKLNEIGTLPVHPLFYPLILEAVEQDCPQQVAEVLPYDVGMVANILKVVMNSFFGEVKSLPSLEILSRMLGVETLKEMVCSQNEFAHYQDILLPEFSVLNLWRHCLRTAKHAAAIARAESKDPQLINSCYLGGLLHDTGKLALLLTLGRSYAQALAHTEEKGLLLKDVEMQELGISHEAVGAYLLGLWGLPLNIVEVLAFHLQPEYSRKSGFKPLAAVHVANVFDHFLVSFSDKSQKRPLHKEYLEKSGLLERLPAWKKACEEVYRQEIRDKKLLLL